MTIFRYIKNGKLYYITSQARGGYKAHPFNHTTEIGITYASRFREFKHGMTMNDFVAVSET